MSDGGGGEMRLRDRVPGGRGQGLNDRLGSKVTAACQH